MTKNGRQRRGGGTSVSSMHFAQHNSALVANTQAGQTVFTCPTGVPVRYRLRNFRFNIATTNGAGVAEDFIVALVRVPSGDTAGTLTFSSGAIPYPDMRNVLALATGITTSTTGPTLADTLRVMKRSVILSPGDTIASVVILGAAGNYYGVAEARIST